MNRNLWVFDWDKASEIIKAQNAKNASTELWSSWEMSCGVIWYDGHIYMEDRPFLASSWDIPTLEIDYEFIPCYRMQSETPGWDENTIWPDSAREIVDQKGE